MRLAAAYGRILKAYDPLLRMRWSDRRELWLLERKAAYERVDLDPDVYGDREHDTIRQLADGYFTLGVYQPHDLPTVHQLIAYLKSQDVQRMGKTAEAVADELDADYWQRRETRKQQANRKAGEVAGEVWESDRWASGQRVVVPRQLPGQ